MLWKRDKHVHYEKNPIFRFASTHLRVSKSYHGSKFFVRDAGQLLATPLLLVLIVIEITDVTFAVDSIPAIFGITRDPFIVYTSNVFAILGLRGLARVLALSWDRFSSGFDLRWCQNGAGCLVAHLRGSFFGRGGNDSASDDDSFPVGRAAQEILFVSRTRAFFRVRFLRQASLGHSTLRA
jgi:hypothetical protein